MCDLSAFNYPFNQSDNPIIKVLNCVINLRDSLLRANYDNCDANYIKVIPYLEEFCSAAKGLEVNCTELRNCSETIDSYLSKSVKANIAKRHLIKNLLRFSRSFLTRIENFIEKN